MTTTILIQSGHKIVYIKWGHIVCAQFHSNNNYIYSAEQQNLFRLKFYYTHTRKHTQSNMPYSRQVVNLGLFLSLFFRRYPHPVTFKSEEKGKKNESKLEKEVLSHNQVMNVTVSRRKSSNFA